VKQEQKLLRGEILIKVLILQDLLEDLREFLYNHQNVIFEIYNSNFFEKLKEENWDIVYFENRQFSIPGKIVVSTIKEFQLAVLMLEEKFKFEDLKRKFDMLFLSPELQGPVIRKFLNDVLEKNKNSLEITFKYEKGIVIEEYKKFFSQSFPFTKIKFSKTKGIVIPPLRNRKDDIPFMVDKILSSIYSNYKHLIKRIPEEYEITLLKEYNWPGNTKELIKVIYNYVSSGNLDIPSNNIKKFEKINLPEFTDSLIKHIEKKYIKLALKNSKSRKEASKLLNMNYKTLSYKIKLYRLDDK
jgi:hypothetical protein